MKALTVDCILWFPRQVAVQLSERAIPTEFMLTSIFDRAQTFLAQCEFRPGSGRPESEGDEALFRRVAIPTPGEAQCPRPIDHLKYARYGND